MNHDASHFESINNSHTQKILCKGYISENTQSQSLFHPLWCYNLCSVLLMTHIFLSLKKGIIVASGFGYAFKGGQGVLLATSLQVASRH